jgi:hypothetical protein
MSHQPNLALRTGALAAAAGLALAGITTNAAAADGTGF